MNIVNIHRRDTPNQGDLASAPLKYFKLRNRPVYLDILSCHKPSERILDLLYSADYIVIGGGGLLDIQKFHGSIDFLAKKFGSKSIIWGAGSNFVGEKISTSDFSSFIKVGIRDINSHHQWVPCASCLSSDIIDIRLNPRPFYKGGIGIIENNAGQVVAAVSDCNISGIRRIGNKKTPMREILEFIASCDVLITSSFHGVYWATLLAVPVIGVPTSSKFYKMKHPAPLASKDNWTKELKNTKLYSDALDDCISANLDFLESFPSNLRAELHF